MGGITIDNSCVMHAVPGIIPTEEKPVVRALFRIIISAIHDDQIYPCIPKWPKGCCPRFLGKAEDDTPLPIEDPACIKCGAECDEETGGAPFRSRRAASFM